MRDFILQLAARREDEESGQAMVEYGLILALVSVVAIGVLATIGTDIQSVFQAIETALANAL